MKKIPRVYVYRGLRKGIQIIFLRHRKTNDMIWGTYLPGLYYNSTYDKPHRWIVHYGHNWDHSAPTFRKILPLFWKEFRHWTLGYTKFRVTGKMPAY